MHFDNRRCSAARPRPCGGRRDDGLAESGVWGRGVPTIVDGAAGCRRCRCSSLSVHLRVSVSVTTIDALADGVREVGSEDCDRACSARSGGCCGAATGTSPGCAGPGDDYLSKIAWKRCNPGFNHLCQVSNAQTHMQEGPPPVRRSSTSAVYVAPRRFTGSTVDLAAFVRPFVRAQSRETPAAGGGGALIVHVQGNRSSFTWPLCLRCDRRNGRDEAQGGGGEEQRLRTPRRLKAARDACDAEAERGRGAGMTRVNFVFVLLVDLLPR